MNHMVLQLLGFARELLQIAFGMLAGFSIGQQYEIRRQKAKPTISPTVRQR